RYTKPNAGAAGAGGPSVPQCRLHETCAGVPAKGSHPALPSFPESRELSMTFRSPALARAMVMAAMFVLGPTVAEVSHAQAAAANYNLPDFTDLVEKASPAVVNIRTTE